MFSLIWSKPRLTKKVWLKRNELIKFSKLVVWATRTEEYRFSFELLRVRIGFLWDHSGSNFTFKYLKEVTRIVIRVLAGSIVVPSKDIFVKLDKRTGLPVVIPRLLCDVILEKGALKRRRGVIIALITILSVYRVLPTTVKVSFETITSPFTGRVRDLDKSLTKVALERLGISRIKLPKMRLIGGEASGPNSYKAIWGCVIDALAFWHSPKHLVYLMRWMLRASPLFALWFIVCFVLGSPYYLLSLLFGANRAELGRLSVVYDQAGKARVIAITNWWIQLCFKPLHDSLFSRLRQLETDGTFDQGKPFERLIRRAPGKFHGFDLSAATDRLPIDLQVSILNLLGLDGNLWAKMLSIPWFYSIGHGDGFHVRYSVGQPMGAYSSWAMLALTHHVLVQVAAQEAGVSDFSDYCVLGDDVVICNDTVAERYLSLMDTLGVGISLGKSVISDKFTEFAKTLRGPHVDISPIGPGLILRSIRHRFYVCRLVTEIIDHNLLRFHDVVDRIMLAPKFIRRYHSLLMWTLLVQHVAIKTPVLDGPDEDPMGPGVMIDWLTAGAVAEVIAPVKEQVERRLRQNRVLYFKAVRYFFLYGWRVSQIRIGLPALSDVLYFLVSPGTWYYLHSFVRTYVDDILRREVRFEDYIFANSMSKLRSEPWSAVATLLEFLDLPSIKTIDWREKEKIREAALIFGVISKKIDETSLLESLPFGKESSDDELDSRLESLLSELTDLPGAFEDDGLPSISLEGNGPRDPKGPVG